MLSPIITTINSTRVLNSKNTHLVRPQGAWWRDPEYKPPSYLNSFNAMRELARLEDQSLDNYHETNAMQPGHGLVGKLWSDGRDPTISGVSEFGSFHGQGSRGSFQRSASRSFRKMMASTRFLSGDDADKAIMHWFDIDFIANDEEHIPDERYKSFIHAGIGQASGVIFNVRGYEGIVIYFAKSDTPQDVLQIKSNTDFLVGAADCIGATLAVDESRRASLHEKSTFENFAVLSQEDLSGASSIRSRRYSNLTTEGQDISSHRKSLAQEIHKKLCFKMQMLLDKAFGEKKAKPPPAMAYSDSVWVFVGSFVTLSLVTFLSQGILFWKDDPDLYAFPVGPFGALATLLFALTNAPVAQPRNIVFGTIIAGVTGLSSSYFDTAIPHWLRLTLGTSAALTIMAKLGVTHPPAGALATIFSSGKYHWGHLLLTLLANTIAIFMAIVINNFSKKKQYPQYWK